MVDWKVRFLIVFHINGCTDQHKTIPIHSLRSKWVTELWTWLYQTWNYPTYKKNKEAWLDFWILRVIRQKKYIDDAGIFMMCAEVKSWVFNSDENGVENLQQEEKASKVKPEMVDWELFRFHISFDAMYRT